MCLANYKRKQNESAVVFVSVYFTSQMLLKTHFTALRMTKEIKRTGSPINTGRNISFPGIFLTRLQFPAMTDTSCGFSQHFIRVGLPIQGINDYSDARHLGHFCWMWNSTQPVWNTPAVQCTLVPECCQFLIIPPVQVDAYDKAQWNQDVHPVLTHHRCEVHHDAWNYRCTQWPHYRSHLTQGCSTKKCYIKLFV